MNSSRDYKVIVFYSTHKTLLAEKTLKKNQVPVMVIPLPKEVSADCGLGLKFMGDMEDKVVQVMQSSNIKYSQIFPVNR